MFSFENVVAVIVRYKSGRKLIDNQLKKDRNILIDSSNLDSNQVKIFNAGNLDYYHTSDALLIEAEKYKNSDFPVKMNFFDITL